MGIPGAKLMRGLPLHFLFINENNLCSILFHLLMPEGKYDTFSVRPKSFDSSCDFTFHNFTRTPLLSPESAVMYMRSSCGLALSLQNPESIDFTDSARISRDVLNSVKIYP